MDDRMSHDRVMAVHNLRDYFRTSIDDVIARQGVNLDPQATCYVVNLITLYARSEEFYEDDGKTYGVATSRCNALATWLCLLRASSSRVSRGAQSTSITTCKWAAAPTVPCQMRSAEASGVTHSPRFTANSRSNFRSSSTYSMRSRTVARAAPTLTLCAVMKSGAAPAVAAPNDI